ncbi:MAG: phosphate ABC transporter substrate-binding/OmpA family protein [Pseudomonadota bacterium]
MTLVAATLFPASSNGETINLSSQDGSVNITGEFVAFEDNIYLIRTPLGDLRLSAERVRCSGAACPSFESIEADVTFAGSDTIGLGVLPLIIEGYAVHLDAESTVVATGNGTETVASLVGETGYGEDIGAFRITASSSGDAFRALLGSEAEIGMSSRRISSQEAQTLRAAGAGDMTAPTQEHIVAVDSIVVITHPDNPVDSISMADLAKIYTGRITNWAQVGGPNRAIKVIERQDEAGTRAVFADRVFGAAIRNFAGAEIAFDNAEMANLVSADEGAIGYTGFAFQRGTKPVTLVNECGLGMLPDAFSARTEEYAIQRRMYLYNRADLTSPLAQDFLDYAMSPEADELVAKAGFIDLGVARRSQAADSERARQMRTTQVPNSERRYVSAMMEAMETYDRLSTTFRFRTGSSQLDERAVVDMERLTAYLETQPPGTSVKLVGFTDSVGKFSNNLRLATGRAAQVRDALLAHAGNRIADLKLETAAFGEIAPAACNISDSGRAINRRVEVWIEADSATPAAS